MNVDPTLSARGEPQPEGYGEGSGQGEGEGVVCLCKGGGWGGKSVGNRSMEFLVKASPSPVSLWSLGQHRHLRLM